MAWFTKKEWKNRLAEFAGRRTLTDVATGASQVVDVARNEGTISQEGDAFSAANMNEFEQRILEGFTQAENATTELNQNMQKVKTYVGTDGKLHFVDASGADTVLPFKNKISVLKSTSSGTCSGTSFTNAQIAITSNDYVSVTNGVLKALQKSVLFIVFNGGYVQGHTFGWWRGYKNSTSLFAVNQIGFNYSYSQFFELEANDTIYFQGHAEAGYSAPWDCAIYLVELK